MLSKLARCIFTCSHSKVHVIDHVIDHVCKVLYCRDTKMYGSYPRGGLPSIPGALPIPKSLIQVASHQFCDKLD